MPENEFDAFTFSHLSNWLRERFGDDEINKNAAFEAITKLVAEDSEWLRHSWPDMLRASEFVERFRTEKPCYTQEAMNLALENARLFVRTDTNLCWQVRALEFDTSGKVKRFNVMFQPLKRFEKVELYGITNESFYTLEF
jgi:hypothetical protein